ncbi:hypothetical protein [Pseudogemmobacter faecipullorum]|uniref:DUF1127 domain-containing protein n=1 Tax=Pseudogemmobacter faecipullorum TaxID=2755041 RepID=A0ABS8CP14_9RHOB|nr:hypothetical protein [Pseudogemmobacter faecipullorum]MCB5411139.1 hypothetical protein [Pseudogemmobacter faecipullorum]
MFARLRSLFQLRRSTAFLLDRKDDRLLEDIGLTRADLMDMRAGLPLLSHAAPKPVTRRIVQAQSL